MLIKNFLARLKIFKQPHDFVEKDRAIANAILNESIVQSEITEFATDSNSQKPDHSHKNAPQKIVNVKFENSSKTKS